MNSVFTKLNQFNSGIVLSGAVPTVVAGNFVLNPVLIVAPDSYIIINGLIYTSLVVAPVVCN